MGLPDPRRIDGMGGGDPLTSKVAVISPSPDPGADVDDPFYQVFVDKPLVSDAQTCGNILAGVGPFAIERGLVVARDGTTEVRVRNTNTGRIAVQTVQTPGGRVTYAGTARNDGVPGTAAPVAIAFRGTAGSSCGALLPTKRAEDLIDGITCTLIDDGMPSVIMAAADFGLRGDEPPEALDASAPLRARLEAIRLKAGPMMTPGAVARASVPKMVLVSPPARRGAIATRSFIPHVCHRAIGVLGAVTVAGACLLPAGPAVRAARLPEGDPMALAVEHPGGALTVLVRRAPGDGGAAGAAVVSTARKLADGVVFA